MTIAASELPSTRLGLLSRLEQLLAEESQIVKKLAELETPESVAEETRKIVERRNQHLASMRGSVKILGDIVSPAADPDDWEANR